MAKITRTSTKTSGVDKHGNQFQRETFSENTGLFKPLSATENSIRATKVAGNVGNVAYGISEAGRTLRSMASNIADASKSASVARQAAQQISSGLTQASPGRETPDDPDTERIQG